MSAQDTLKRARACRCILAALIMVFTLSGAPAHAGEKGKAAGVEWLNYEKGLEAAKAEGRFVVLDFYTTWCRDCKKLDALTFSDPEVVRMLCERFTTIKVDGEQRPELTSMYGVFAYPTVWILAPDGTKLHQKIGFMSAEEFKAVLEYAASGAYKESGFNEFVRERSKREKM